MKQILKRTRIINTIAMMRLNCNLKMIDECNITEGKYYDVEIKLLHYDEVIALR